MKENPKLTIVTINLNNKEGLHRTIESVVAQTAREFEYIVIDGGSTDGSVEVIKEYTEYIDYWVSEPDKGIYNAMNKGVQRAHGTFCQFLNSGDILFSSRVVANVLKQLNFSVDIFCGATMVKKTVQWVKECAPDKLSMPLFMNSGLCHQSTFIKTSLLKKRPYNEQMKVSSDWIFFVECYLYENVHYAKLKESISFYEGNGVSSNGQLLMEERYKFLDKIQTPLLLKEYMVLPHEIIESINLIPHSYTFHKFLIFINSWLISAYRFIKRI